MSASRLAIDGGTPVRRRPWPPPHPVDREDRRVLLAVLKEENWSSGTRVRELEDRFAAFCGAGHAVMVPNGTAALRLALLALDVGPGDEVILPGITWHSVPIAVMDAGADPVTVDVDPATYGLSAATVREAITDRTRAIIPTHLFCSQTDLPPILDLAREHRLVVIEDAAHSPGARRFGKALGTFGDAGFFSFNQKKLLTCGEGGCLVTDDVDLGRKARALRAVDPTCSERLPALPGTLEVSEFQAAVLISQLRKLPARLALVEERAERLREVLEAISSIEVLGRLPGTNLQTFYSFCFRVKGLGDISWFRRALAAELGASVGGAYLPLSDAPMLRTNRPRRYEALGRQLKRPLRQCQQAHYQEAVRFHHTLLTGDADSLADVERAVVKVLSAPPPPRASAAIGPPNS